VNVLGFDTSTAASTACLLRDDGEAFEAGPPAGSPQTAPRHAGELLPRIVECLDRAGLGFRDVDIVAVGRGPGAFTGLRIGFATARALGQAHSIPVRTVPTLQALAAGMSSPLALPLIDARRGEVFGALYESTEQRWDDFAASPEALVSRLRESGLRPLAAGDGSLRFRELLETAGVRVAPGSSPSHLVRALNICRLAARDQPATPITPLYLREPDARPSR